MNFKKIMVLALVMTGSSIVASPVADQMQGVSRLLYNPVDPRVPGQLVQLVLTSKCAKCEEYANNLMKIGQTLFQASQIVEDTEKFINEGLPKIEAAASRLAAEIKCDQGAAHNVCIAAILKDFNEILRPVVNHLIARKSPAAMQQGEAKALELKKPVIFADQFAPYDQGALLSLGSLPVIPADYRTKITKEIANFANQINGGMTFSDTLRFIINPEVPTIGMSEGEKKQLQEIKENNKAEPVVLPVEDLDF